MIKKEMMMMMVVMIMMVMMRISLVAILTHGKKASRTICRMH